MSLTPQEEAQIQNLSEGLSQEEVLAYLGKEPSDYTEEQWIQFQKAWKRGRTMFKVHAVTKLKESMSGRNGLQASLAALIRFADDWPEGSDLEDKLGSTKSFRIVLDD